MASRIDGSVGALYTPFTLKSVTLKNRIVMAPMTRGFAVGGLPGEPQVEYYRRRALGAVGLILTEGTVIERPAARNEAYVPFFHGPALDGWRQVAEAVHAAGGRIGPQLWHTGAVRSLTTDWVPEVPVESPSGLMAPGRPNGCAMTEEDIADSIDAWARAAADAVRLGFDVIEIHGAHGYLVDQFFWSATNLREDRYGGATLRERSRYAAEVVAAMRRAVGPEFPILLRVSQWKQQDYAARLAETPAAMADWLCPLAEAGVDLFDCSQRRYWEPEFAGSDLNFAGWAKKLTGKTSITVGSVGLSGDFLGAFKGEASTPTSLDELRRRFDRGDFDLVAVGRALIADAGWSQKIREGRSSELVGFTKEALATLA